MVTSDTKPWYRQFWPCFLLGILMMSICSGLTMAFLAINSADGLVKDDYYKDGLAINKVLVHDTLAQQLNVQAEININNEKDISVTLFHDKSFSVPPALTLDFIFPTRANRDQTITLQKTADGHYQGSSNQPIRGHWYLELKPDAQSWRLTGEIYLPQQPLLLLKPHS